MVMSSRTAITSGFMTSRTAMLRAVGLSWVGRMRSPGRSGNGVDFDRRSGHLAGRRCLDRWNHEDVRPSVAHHGRGDAAEQEALEAAAAMRAEDDEVRPPLLDAIQDRGVDKTGLHPRRDMQGGALGHLAV